MWVYVVRVPDPLTALPLKLCPHHQVNVIFPTPFSQSSLPSPCFLPHFCCYTKRHPAPEARNKGGLQSYTRIAPPPVLLLPTVWPRKARQCLSNTIPMQPVLQEAGPRSPVGAALQAHNWMAWRAVHPSCCHTPHKAPLQIPL